MSYDADYGSVSLLLHADGTNGSTTITDSSLSPKTITVAGDAQISTTQSKFGGASMKFDGAGDYLSLTAANLIGTGDFTVEGWIYANSTAADGEIFCIGNQASNSQFDFLFEMDAGGILRGSLQNGAGVAQLDISSAAAAITATTFTHVAFCVEGTTGRLFVNGTQVQSGTVSGTRVQARSDGRIGSLSTANPRYFDGYIDELRITTGVARYTTGFTPPTEAFAAQASETASAALVAPKQTLEFFGGGYARLTGPSPFVYAGDIGRINAALAAPSARLSAAVRSSYGDNALFATAPSPTLHAYAGDNASLTAPSPTLVVTATGTALLTATLIAPSPTLTAAGTSTGMLRAAITGPSPNLIGYGGAVCSITGPMGTLVATGTTGSTLSARVTVPMAQLTATVTRQGSMSALLTAPSPRMGTTLQAYLIAPGATLTAIGSATITATYEAYALNLNHTTDTNDELTHYTNFPFTHVVRYKNSYYGANSTGLYLLEGTTDDGDPIEWSFKTGMTDLDSPQIKTVTYAYFGGRLGPGATVTIYPSEPTGTSYAYTTPRGQVAQNYRQKFGKGLKARYFAIGASGNDVLESDSIDLTVATLTRRI